ncbi:MAG: ATP synthase F0 subunit B [Planctomycetota bacterium]|nr:MAG: ATP synthase F0 subunit B [Planctomycetota bacterium]
MRQRVLLAGIGMLAMSSSLWAAAEEHGGGGGPSPFAGDFGNALWTIVVFLVVLVVLGKFAWGPILGALQQREAFIRESLEEAQKQREEAEARLREYTAKIEAARAEASAIVEEGRRDAEALRAKIQADAKAEADAMLQRAKREIALATDSAVHELYALGAKLATGVASRIIRKELDPADHERLIAESIEELRGAGCGGNGRGHSV